jgi:hypothetical protein
VNHKGAEAGFSVRISRASDTHGPDTYRIAITDEVSRLQIVEVRLTAQQFAEAVTGLGVQEAEGTLIADAARGLLGRRMEHCAFALGRVSEETCKEWADEANVLLHADRVEHSRTNVGWKVTFRWYLPTNHVGIDMDQARKLASKRPLAR